MKTVDETATGPDPAKAATLAGALPWLKRYHGKVVVVKYGGNAMTDDTLKRAFAEDVAFLRFAGFKPVVVHGGGPQISAMLDRLGIESEFKGGLRVTTPPAMDVVRMVLVGQVQRELVGLVNEHGPLAVGLSGEDAGLFTARRTNTVVDGEEVDLGLVGEVAEVRPEAVLDLVEAGRIPVISSVAPDKDGVVHNVNADTAAAALAVALGAEKLLVLTDVEGLYRDWPGERRRDRRDQPRRPRRADADPGCGNGPEDGCLPAGRAGRSPARDRRRRPRAARRPARAVHRRGRGHPGAPRRRHQDPEGPRMSTISDRYADVLMNTFGPPQLVLSRGKGARVWDDDGREYVDLLGGIAVNSLGHAHPAVVEAVTRQLSTLGHISNFFASEPQVTLAERLLGHLGPPRAEEAAHQGPDAGRRQGVLHQLRRRGQRGRAEAEPAYRTDPRGRRRGLLPRPDHGSARADRQGGVPRAVRAAARRGHLRPVRRLRALAAAVTDETAAVVLEPIQGEAGVVEPPPGYLVDARRVTRDHGALLWLDEVQTGIGRTGSWLCAAADPEVAPDVVTLAKGLGGGLPIGACIGVGPAGDLLQPGHHGTTFGGNPVACAAALAVLDTIVDEGLLDRARVVGDRLRAGVAAHPQVTAVRGRGLLIGIDVATDAARVVTVARSHGFIVNATGPHTVRLAPPLVLGDDEAEAFLAAWPGILDDAVEPDDSAD